MANTFTSAALTLMSDLALPYLKAKAPLISAFSTNLSADVVSKGTGVFVTYTAPASASIWTSTFAPSAQTITGVTVTMREPYFRSAGFSPNEIASYTPEGLVTKVVGPQINDVLTEVHKQVYFTFNTSNVTNTVYSGSGILFNFTASQAGAQFLDTSGSSKNVALFNSVLDYALDANLSSNFGAAAGVVNGTNVDGRKVGKLDQVFPAYNLPTFGVGVAGIACSPDSIAIATRIPDVASPNAQVFVTQDPQSGLAVATAMHVDDTLGQFIIKSYLSVGLSFGRPGMAAYYKDLDHV